jgi:ATP-dependent Lon protease
VLALITEAHRRAKEVDGQEKSLTLRLRELGGLIRSAGDLAVTEKSPLIEPKHIKDALKRARSAEEQIKAKYGSYYGGVAKDISESQKSASPYNYWNYHPSEGMEGYK